MSIAMETVGKHLLLFQYGGARFEGNFVSLRVAKEFLATDAGCWTWGANFDPLSRPLEDARCTPPKTGDSFFWALIDMSSTLPFFKERVLFFRQVTIRIQQTFAPQEGVGGGARTQVCHLISAVKSIKSTHRVPPFSCFFFLFGGDVL